MTYDPEYSLELEQYLNELHARTELLRARLGDDHPLVKHFDVFNDLYEETCQSVQEARECFDEARERNLRAEISQDMALLSLLWAAIQKKFETLQEQG